MFQNLSVKYCQDSKGRIQKKTRERYQSLSQEEKEKYVFYQASTKRDFTLGFEKFAW